MDKNMSWRKNLLALTHGKCRGCPSCDGYGCKGELPGMGALGNNDSFINNVSSWKKIYSSLPLLSLKERNDIKIGVAPVTGVDENMGSPRGLDEKEFLSLLIASALKAKADISIGDGFPDYKLQNGIEGLMKAGGRGYVFIKPYPNKKILERIEWTENVALCVGIDIDAASIKTMAQKATLEEKSVTQLKQIKEAVNHKGLPFVVKGIHTNEMIELVKQVKPDVAYISNHGGRVVASDSGIGFFLEKNGSTIAGYCDQMWADSGIRSYEDLLVAFHFGVKRCFTGRMSIEYVAHFGIDGISQMLKHQYRLNDL